MHKFSISRRHLIKATAATVMLPTLGFSEAKKPAQQATRRNRHGILGHQAPELEVDDWIDGKGNKASFKLADHKGKFVFMKFWQYWCPGCHSHGLPSLKKISEALSDNPHFVALSVQTVFEGSYINTASKRDNIQNKYDLHDLVMGHETGKDKPYGRPSTMINYRTGGTPWIVLIAPDGTVIFNDFHINPEPTIDYIKKETAKLS